MALNPHLLLQVKRTADLSTALRFGRDDNFAVGRGIRVSIDFPLG
jgi:hypothetical protein